MLLTDPVCVCASFAEDACFVDVHVPGLLYHTGVNHNVLS